MRKHSNITKSKDQFEGKGKIEISCRQICNQPDAHAMRDHLHFFRDKFRWGKHFVTTHFFIVIVVAAAVAVQHLR